MTITRVREGSESEILNRISVLSTEGKQGETTKWKDIAKEYRYWVFTLKHPHLGKGEFRIMTATGDLPDNRGDLLEVLGFCFAGEGLPRHKLVRATKGGKFVHFVGSGHAPEEGDTLEFDNLDEASKAGFKPCLLCFNRRILLANIDAELALGRETEANIRHYHQIAKDAELQNRVERIGRKVLANWLTPLIGFNYRFNVVDDSDFQAVACAGGYIFVNRGLVNLVESDEELEVVLAHEIAHVEQRHGIKELIRARKQANATAIFGAVVAGAAGAAAASANNQGWWPAATEATAAFGLWVYWVGAQIAIQGYSREHEMEADIYALNYLQKMGYSRQVLLSVLRKVRTRADLDNPTSPNEVDMFSSHPAPNNRIHVANTIAFDEQAKDVIFDIFNKDDELVYSMTFQGSCNYSRRDGSVSSMVLLDVSTTAALAETKSVNELTLTYQNEKVPTAFRSDGPYELTPMDRTALAFSCAGKLSLKPENISTLRLKGIDSAKVVRRNTSP